MVTVDLTNIAVRVQGADDLHAKIMQAMESDTSVALDIRNIDDADISFFQTIESARRHAATSRSSITLTEPLSEPMRKILHRAGFMADTNPQDMMFWLHEG